MNKVAKKVLEKEGLPTLRECRHAIQAHNSPMIRTEILARLTDEVLEQDENRRAETESVLDMARQILNDWSKDGIVFFKGDALRERFERLDALSPVPQDQKEAT